MSYTYILMQASGSGFGVSGTAGVRVKHGKNFRQISFEITCQFPARAVCYLKNAINIEKCLLRMFTFRGSDILLFIFGIFFGIAYHHVFKFVINLFPLLPFRDESILFYSVVALWGITFCKVVSSL